MPKHDKPILDIQVVRANRDHSRRWKTCFHDYCLLEGYRNPAKDRITDTENHYITAKRPFELAVLHSAIKDPNRRYRKTLGLATKNQGTLRWSKFSNARLIPLLSKMLQADQTSISAWETEVCTAAGRCSFGEIADEFMRDKFLFRLNKSFTRPREDTFYRDGQRKPDDPPFTLAFVVSQAVSFEAAQQTNKLLANSGSHSNKSSCFFCGSRQQHPWDICPASGQTCSYCHNPGHLANVCQQAARDHRTSRPTYKHPLHIRMVEQEENITLIWRRAYSTRTVLPSGTKNPSVPTPLQRLWPPTTNSRCQGPFCLA